jgi:transposase
VYAAAGPDVFNVFVEQILALALRYGDVVIRDNLPAHKSPELNTAIKSTQAKLLPLPRCLPDFHPVELC